MSTLIYRASHLPIGPVFYQQTEDAQCLAAARGVLAAIETPILAHEGKITGPLFVSEAGRDLDHTVMMNVAPDNIDSRQATTPRVLPLAVVTIIDRSDVGQGAEAALCLLEEEALLETSAMEETAVVRDDVAQVRAAAAEVATEMIAGHASEIEEAALGARMSEVGRGSIALVAEAAAVAHAAVIVGIEVGAIAEDETTRLHLESDGVTPDPILVVAAGPHMRLGRDPAALHQRKQATIPADQRRSKLTKRFVDTL